MNTDPIYIVDDDRDDEELITEAIRELGYQNEIKFFGSGEEILKALKGNSIIPFIILSDINLAKMNGFELREKILKETSIKDKSVPFIFWSTTASETQIKRAYELSAHGFFIKSATFTELKRELDEIIRYWTDSRAPQV